MSIQLFDSQTVICKTME